MDLVRLCGLRVFSMSLHDETMVFIFITSIFTTAYSVEQLKS